MRRLPLAMLWAWALAAGASACGTSDDDASVADPLTDAATDAPSLDGSPLDAAADASDAEPVDASEHDAPEDQMSPDADPDADADADAEPVFAHCPVLANPPGWVDRTVEGYAAVVRTAAVDIYLDAFDDGIVRVHQSAPGQAPSARSWAVETMPARDPQVVLGADNDDFVLCTRWMMLRIAPDGRIVAQDATGQPIMTDLAGPGLEEGHESVDGESVRTVKVVRALGSTQQLYGFGEHTGPLNKRGQRMTFWNTDAYDSNYGGYGPTADPLYQSVPFFISLTEGIASGVFTDNPFRLVMDMGATDPGRYEIKAYGGTIDQYLIAGPRMSEVVRRYALLTGTAPLPPSLGAWLSPIEVGLLARQRIRSNRSRVPKPPHSRRRAMARHPAPQRLSHVHLGPGGLPRPGGHDCAPCISGVQGHCHCRPWHQAGPQLGCVPGRAGRQPFPQAA